MQNKVYIFGDSHCVIFVGAERACVCGQDGASITGLNKPNSTLDYANHVLTIIKPKPKTDKILIKLGQVDLEFIMYHKLYIKREVFTFEAFCKSLIDSYREFIKHVLEINSNVIIASIHLPSYRKEVDVRSYIARIVTGNDNVLPQLELEPALSEFSVEQLTKNFTYFNSLLKD